MKRVFFKFASATGSLLLSLLAACSNTTPATPDFGLTLGSPTITIKQTQAGQLTVSVNKIGSFQDTVALNLENAPSGVTGSFNPASTTSSSTLSLNVALAAALGDTTLTVKGVAGSLTRTATFKLTVTAAPTTGDTTPPTVVKTTAKSKTSVEVIFSEQVVGGNVASNFSFPFQDLSVNAASVAADNKTVTLTTSSQTTNASYALLVSPNIKDLADNAYTGSSDPPLATNFSGL